MSSIEPRRWMEFVLGPLPVFVALPDQWKCVVCRGVLKDPWQTECGHRMCRSCMTRIFEFAEEVMCLAYYEDCVMISTQKMHHDKAACREIVSYASVYCKYMDTGCTATMTWSQLKSHVEKCEFGSNAHASKNALAVNIKLASQDQTEEQDVIQKANSKRDTLATKTEWKEDNRIWQEMLSRDKSQLRNLDKRVVRLEQDSRTRSGGLSGETLGKLEATTQKVGVHDIRLAEMGVRIQCLERANYEGVLIWKVTDYTRRRRETFNDMSLSLYSQPFYTGRYGYKMCGCLYMGRDTHLSLFFVLMRGTSDALLEWPFRQEVTLSLLDQSPARRDLSDTFRPDPTNSSFRRPTTEMNIASGCPMFISHQDLQNSRFLKDDTIFMKIVVDTTYLMPR